MQNDLISIIAIVYNTSKYLSDCLESLINQTYRNIEIIVVNDGSTDNSEQIINKYLKIDNRVKFINRKENKGTMYTRKEGYHNSNGKYVTFIDSDDMLELNAIEKMYNVIKENNANIVKCNFSKLINNKKINDCKFEKNCFFIKENFEPDFYDLLYKTINLNSMCGMLIKKTMLSDIDKVNSSMIYGEDLTNNLYLYNKIDSITIITDCLYIYRQNMNSITYAINEKRVVKKLEDAIKTYYAMYEFVDKYNIKDKNKYKIYATERMKWYTTSFIVTLCSIKKYKEIKRLCEELLMNRKVKEMTSNYSHEIDIFNNKLLIKSVNLLFKKKFYLLYIYSKYIYNNTKRITRLINKILK